MNECSYINVHSTTKKCQYYLPLWLQYRLLFELASSAKFLHFTILGGSIDPIPPKWRPCPFLTLQNAQIVLYQSVTMCLILWPRTHNQNSRLHCCCLSSADATHRSVLFARRRLCIPEAKSPRQISVCYTTVQPGRWTLRERHCQRPLSSSSSRRRRRWWWYWWWC